MRGLSLFSGIGGLDLAAEMAGITPAAFCEVDPFPVSILQKRWFGVPVLRDVREVKGEEFNDIDIVWGGFPCQDLSVAGKQAGLEGERSGLWFEMLRIITEARPRFVLAENVRGALHIALDTVQAGMEGAGYKVWPFIVPAAAFGAPHKRERLFVIGIRSDVANTIDERLQGGERAGAFCEDGTTSSQPAAECGKGSLWPTPTVGTSGGGKLCGGTGHLNMLRDALGYEEARKLSAGNGGQLNPAWVEQLMGFPAGWTSLECDVVAEWTGWPALMGEEQYPYEPPRTVTKCADRAKRLKALGNAVVPAQAFPFFHAFTIMNEVLKDG
jgi:DNA (cytosine-5)-methyltransferase 1